MPLKLRKVFAAVSPAPATFVSAGIFIIFIAFYWHSISDLITLWNEDDTYSHGFIIPLLSVYLLTKQTHNFSQINFKPAFFLLLPLVLSLALWLLATITDTRTIELTLLPLILFLIYSSIGGYKLSTLLIPSVCILLLAVPIWGVLTPLFQTMAVSVNEFALRLSGIPTYINDTTVSIPPGVFEIEGGCSGIRYLIVTLVIGSFYSFTTFKTRRSVLIMLMVSFILPVVFNWVRIYVIILIGYFTEMKSEYVSDHANLGWVLYGISLIPLFFIARKITLSEKNISRSAIKTETKTQNYPHYFILLPLSLLISAPLFTAYLDHSENNTLNKITLPGASPPWQGPIHFNEWQPDYNGASIEKNSLYIGMNNTADVSLHIFYYGQETQGAELINELNTIASTDQIISQQIVKLDTHDVVETSIINNNKKRLIWYWYFINNRYTTRAVIAKLLQSNERISGNIHSSLIAISTECHSQCISAKHTLEDFLKKHEKKIITAFSDRKG